MIQIVNTEFGLKRWDSERYYYEAIGNSYSPEKRRVVQKQAENHKHGL
jgi:hypothetical protein